MVQQEIGDEFETRKIGVRLLEEICPPQKECERACEVTPVCRPDPPEDKLPELQPCADVDIGEHDLVALRKVSVTFLDVGGREGGLR